MLIKVKTRRISCERNQEKRSSIPVNSGNVSKEMQHALQATKDSKKPSKSPEKRKKNIADDEHPSISCSIELAQKLAFQRYRNLFCSAEST